MRKSVRIAVLGTVLAAIGTGVLPARAQERAAPEDSLPLIRVPPIVVTATRSETPREEVASAISVVSREEIERRQYRSASEALEDVPGVAIARAGGPGGQTSVFLRGASPDQTLVLIDGVEMNDPSAPAAAFDFANVLLHDVDRIEVLRGPQSPLYGSNAMGGVIQIFTRRGEDRERALLRGEAGSFGTWRSTASASGGTGTLRWAATGTREETDGISVNEALSGDPEEDRNRATGFSGRLDWAPVPGLQTAFTVRGNATETGLDQGGPDGDDPNFEIETDEFVVRAEARWESLTERWEQRFGFGFADHDRETRDEFDPARPETRSSGAFEGERWRAEWLHTVRAPFGRVVGGLEHERENAASTFESEGPFGPFESEFPREDASITGLFLQHQGDFAERLHWSIGARVDDHDRFGSATTWRLAPTFRIPETATRLRATYGTGFKAPSLFQLLDPAFGNPDLDPERSAGWDVGVEQGVVGGRLRVSAAWFGADYEDIVDFAFPDGFRNLGAARARGVEASVTALPREDLRFVLGYTYTDSENAGGGDDDGLALLRRPRHAADLAVEWARRERSLALVLRYVGEREDVDFAVVPSERVTLEPYWTARLAGSVRILPGVQAFARVENLFDERFEEVLHFRTPGRGAYAGLEVEL